MSVASVSAKVCVHTQVHAPDTRVHVHIHTEWPKEPLCLLFLSAYSFEAESLPEPGDFCFLLSFT